jgi:5'(3')-deoxyribonucleotidase
MSLRLAIDIDGVLRDFVSQVNTVFDHYHPDGWRKPVIRYDLPEFYSIGRGIYDLVFKEDPQSVYVLAPVYRGAKKMLEDLKEDGHTIIIATSQPNKEVLKHTLAWLNLNEIPYDEFYCALNLSSKANIKADVLLDDYIKHLKEFPGISVCYAQPWNTEWKSRKVNTYQKFVELIRKLDE